MSLDPIGAAAAIVTAYAAVRWLYDHTADPANLAERRYREFGAAIQGLVRAIDNIEQHFAHGWGDSNGAAANDARAIKCDFLGLLEECEQLLNKHASLQYNRANFLQNVAWGANVQPRIDQLLSRIAVQTQRATFIYSTLSYGNQIDMASKIDHIMRTLDPTIPRALTLDPNQHTIQPAIVTNFRRATYRKPPQGYQSPDEFPFQTGLNTLRSHLKQSTIQCRSGEPQTIHQHISLVKSQWLLQTIKNLNYFQNLRVGTKERTDVQELETMIVKELTREDLTLYSVEELLNQAPNHFFIWETSPKNVQRDHMQPFQQEKEIMNTELPAPPNYQQCRLIAFRDLAHTQGTGLRFSRQWKRNGQLLPPYSNSIDAFAHIFRPLYAYDSSPDHHLGIELCKPDGSQADLYQFKELKDVFKMQWALTNYNVFSDFEDVDWAITRGLKSNIEGKGSRIQMWWFDPDDELEKVAAEIISPASRNSGKNSILSTMTGTAGRSILQNSESQREPSNHSHVTKHSETDVVEAILPYEPLLVVFAALEKRPEYLSLQLHGQMYIDQTKCRCKREENKCLRSVIRSGNNVDCQVKRASSDRTRPNDLPNLNIFARPYRKGGPQHPSINPAASVPTRELTLDFASPSQRRRFNQQFEFILRLQRSREETHAMLLQRAVYLSNKPKGTGNVKDRITGSIEPSNVGSDSSSKRSLSRFSFRTHSDHTTRPPSLTQIWTPPGSATSSTFDDIYELSNDKSPTFSGIYELDGTKSM